MERYIRILHPAENDNSILKTKSNFAVFITEYFYSCFDLIK